MGVRLHVSAAQLAAGPLTLGEAAHRYLARVHRLRVGDEVTLFDGQGREAPARVVAVDDAARTIGVAVGEPQRLAAPGVAITLLVALLKGEKLELVVQKATELGVTAIVPVSCAHCVVRLDERRGAERLRRWQKIAEEAARQSGRASVPAIAPPSPLPEAVASVDAAAVKLVFHEGRRDASLRRALPPAPAQVALLVGPEGGLAPDEVATATAAGFAAVGLGPRVLRAETAAIAAVAAVGALVGDLGGPTEPSR